MTLQTKILAKLTKASTEPEQTAEKKQPIDHKMDVMPLLEDNAVGEIVSVIDFEKASLVKKFAGIVFEKPKVKIR